MTKRETDILRLLKTVSDMGGKAYVNDSVDSWLNPWCSDREDPDMFNEACNKGFLIYRHNSDTDDGSVSLTTLGKAAVARGSL